MIEKKETKVKKTCKKFLSKKVGNNILKMATFMAILFVLIVAFIYIPLMQLSVMESQVKLEHRKVDRICMAQANQQTEQAKAQAEKDKKEVKEEQLKAFAAQQYSVCVYYAGYDLPQNEEQKENTVKSNSEVKQEVQEEVKK